MRLGELTPTRQNLQVYIETLIGFSHVHSLDGLSNTLLSQGCILETAPRVGIVGIFQGQWGVGWAEEHRIGQVQLTGQPVVTSFGLPPPTLGNKNRYNIYI